MRILLTSRDLGHNGIATFVIHISEYLTVRGHEVTVLALPGRRTADARAAGARVVSCPLYFDWQAAPLAAWIRRRGFDVVNAHARRQSEISLAAAGRAQVPFFVTCHGPTSLARMRPVFEGSRLVQVMNEYNYGFFAPTAGEDRMHLARLAVPWDRYQALAGPRGEGGAFRVTYCSRLSPLKTPMALAFLRAADALAPEIPGLEARVAGDGKLIGTVRRLGDEINRRHGRPVCRVLGAVPEVTPIMAQSDVVVGAGYVAVEAFACGCQVIGAGFAGCWGLVTAENFAAALAHNFGDNTDDPLPATAAVMAEHLRHAYALRGTGAPGQVRALAERHFSFDHIGSTIEAAFLRAAAR